MLHYFNVRNFIETLRNAVLVCFQNEVWVSIYKKTFRYNIRFGKPTATDVEVEEAAKAAQIHDKILQLPNGNDFVVEIL